jgi:oligopeptide/dipeptide ABC transporter ATP-binding protein
LALLEVNELRTYFSSSRGTVRAVDGVSFSLDRGQALGLAGESACGKTTTALSLLRLIKFPGRIVSGSVIFDNEDLLSKTREALDKMRWKRISYIPQAAMNGLDPVQNVGRQIVEAIVTHEEVSKQRAWDRASELLTSVGLDSARLRSYPHEFSGGMRQRAIIAMAIACNPDLLIADEPTTALDVVVQRQILQLLAELKSKLGISLILISHDLSVIAEVCDRVCIMYAGEVVENASALNLFKNPLHPYTQGLIRAVPSVLGAKQKLQSIPGYPPSLIDPVEACRFRERCPYAQERCSKERPRLREIEKGHFAACHFAEKLKS